MLHDLFSLLLSSNSESKSQFHNIISACDSDNSLISSSESDCESGDAVLMYMAGWLDLYFFCFFFYVFVFLFL